MSRPDIYARTYRIYTIYTIRFHYAVSELIHSTLRYAVLLTVLITVIILFLLTTL